MMISLDSQAILLICSHLGLASNADLTPLTLRDWNPLAKKLQAMSMRPGDLLGLSESNLQVQFELTEQMAKRIAKLMARSGTLAIELERLESLGIRALTRADQDYPIRYRQRLKDAAPLILFYAGEKALLGQPGIAVVGSRNLDQVGQACAEFVGNTCGLSGLVLYSGGAKGVDKISMTASLKARGTAVGILANSLEKTIRDPDYRSSLEKGDCCLATSFSPNAPFSVGMAMGRNKLIYTLADYAIVVASDAGKGGTWSGATEAIKHQWLPVFVLDHAEMPDGNKQLIKKGALPIPHPFPEHYLQLKEWLEKQSSLIKPEIEQPGLF